MAAIAHEESSRKEERLGRLARLAAVGKNLCQFLRRNHFELRIGAVAGLLVGAPSAKLRHVTEAVCPACARKRLPPPVRDAAAPTTGPCPGSSGSGRPACAARLHRRHAPCSAQLFPRMTGERVLRDTARGIPPVPGAFSCVKLAQTPTCCSAPASSNSPSSSEPTACARLSCASESRRRRNRNRARA